LRPADQGAAAALGGRTALLYRCFPKLCHPVCGMEINLRRIKASRDIGVITMAEVTAITGARGDYTATVKVAPRYVDETGCCWCPYPDRPDHCPPWLRS
jgi:quinone-modifying oxidoreductase subunit QmoA